MHHDTGTGSIRHSGRLHARLGLSLTSLLLACATARAEAPPVSAEEPFFLELPVVLSATRLAQRPQDAPAAVFVIDREMIEASGAREIADLLRLAPGFIVASDGGNQRAISYHGFVDEYGRRLQVLVDGRSVYTPFFGGLAWSDLPLALDDIARIEVIRGPNGATHGANAFLGVVNILTRHPDASQGLYARVAGGDPDYLQGVFRHGFTHGPLEVRYTLGHEEDDGFDIRRNDEVDGKALDLATLDLALPLGARDHLRFQAGIKAGDLVSGGNDIDPVTRVRRPTVDDPPRDDAVSHTFAQLNWERNLDAREQFQLLAYVERLDHDDDFSALLDPAHPDNPLGVPVAVGLGNSRTEERYALELQHLIQPADDLRLAWGGEVRRDEVDSTAFFGPRNPVDNTLLRLFANAEWRMAREWTVNGGLMLEEHDLTGSDVSPRLALNYSPNVNHTLRASASRSVRAPSMWEARWDQYFPLDLDLSGFGLSPIDGIPDLIYQNGRIQETPDNETVEAYEFGWLFDLKGIVPVRGDIKLFYERYENLLVDYTYPFLTRDDLAACGPTNPLFDPSSPFFGFIPYCNVNEGSSVVDEPADVITYGFANQIDLDLYGIEASLEVRPSHRSRVIGSYSLTEMRNLSFNRPELLDYPFRDFGTNPNRQDRTRKDKVEREWGDSVPSHIFSLLAMLRPTPRTTLSAAIYHVSAMEFLETGDGVPAYTRLDLRAAQRFRLSEDWQAELYGVMQNAGQDYADFEGKNRFETRFFVGLKLYQ